jgi:cyanate lyase
MSGLAAIKKAELVERLLAAKALSGKSFDDLAVGLGLTNLYTAQLFMNQTQLRPDTALKLRTLVPDISELDLAVMQKCPMRSFDPATIQVHYIIENEDFIIMTRIMY